MQPENAQDRLDRHALVLAVWLPAGLAALGLLAHGFASGGAWWVAGGFAALIAGFAGHVVVNAALGTWFNPREVGLALVLTALGLVASVLAVLLVEGFAAGFFLPVAGGFATLAAVVVFTMLTRSGARGAFAQFDVVRDNNPRAASRLPHRGGRR